MHFKLAQSLSTIGPTTRALLHNTRALVVLFAVTMLLTAWCGIAYEIDQDRADARAEWTRNLENLTRAFDEHTVRTVASVDDVLKFVRNQYLRQGLKLDLEGMVARGEISRSIYNQIGVIDSGGNYILSSLPFKPMNLADREHFKVHADGSEDKLFVSQPVLGRASGRWSIQLTRRIVDAQGRFAGVVVASLDPAYFGTLYSEVDLGRHGAIALVGDDGITRARRSDGQFSLGQDVSSAPLFKAFRGMHAGQYIETSRIDGRKRLYVFRRLADYPMTVVSAITLNRLYERSDERRDGYLALGAIVTLLTVLFTGLILRLLGRQEKTMAQLKLSRAQAQSANKMKSDFLASMSHELRTPLNGILGFSDLIRHLSDNEKLRHYGDTIHTSGQFLLSILNSILDIAKIEAGKMEINLNREALRPLVEETTGIHAVTAAAKGLAMVTKIAENVPEIIICDGVLLRQVLNNLINNAIKFTEKGGVAVRVALDEQDSGATLTFSVSDTGVGISREAQDLVFEKFSQADQSITRAHQGTGLGLALAKQLVQLMGGRIGLNSEVGRGTTLFFTLPIAPTLSQITQRQALEDA